MEPMNPKLKKADVFERIKYVRDILRPATEGLSEKDVLGIILQVEHFRQRRRKELSEVHRAVYDILLKHELRPKTVYQWFLLERAPSHIKEKLKAKKVSIKDASSMSFAWTRMITTKAGKDIMAQMRAVIGGLQWRGQEELKN